MLTNTTVITFSGSPVHKKLQDEFHEKYDNLFKDSIKYTSGKLKRTAFYKENKEIFSYNKYFGFFAWKPYIIKDALKKSDYVLYCDSNVIIKNPELLGNLLTRGINKDNIFIPKYNHYFNYQWTKRDTFILMDSDEKRYWNAPQVWTSIMGFKNTKKVMDLLDVHEKYCLDERIVTEIPNTMDENLPGFREHRWEQSVMSILVERNNIKGILYNEVLGAVDKIYPQEVYEYKSKINSDPLSKEQ
jgi:hypothetical protein